MRLSPVVVRSTGLALALLFAVAGVPAQETPTHEPELDTQMSVGYEYRRRIREGLRGFGDLVYEEQLNSDRLFGDRNQLWSTGGVSYDVSKKFRVEGGVGIYYTYLPEATDTSEFRLWQAATVDWPGSPGVARRYVFSHRFRLEERFKSTAGSQFTLRLRYRFSFSLPINRYTVEPGAVYVPLKAEFYFPLGEEISELFATQARYSIGVGYVFDKTWRLEARFARQESRDTLGADFETAHQYIELRLKTSVRIRDLQKSR